MRGRLASSHCWITGSSRRRDHLLQRLALQGCRRAPTWPARAGAASGVSGSGSGGSDHDGSERLGPRRHARLGGRDLTRRNWPPPSPAASGRSTNRLLDGGRHRLGGARLRPSTGAAGLAGSATGVPGRRRSQQHAPTGATASALDGDVGLARRHRVSPAPNSGGNERRSVSGRVSAISSAQPAEAARHRVGARRRRLRLGFGAGRRHRAAGTRVVRHCCPAAWASRAVGSAPRRPAGPSGLAGRHGRCRTRSGRQPAGCGSVSAPLAAAIGLRPAARSCAAGGRLSSLERPSSADRRPASCGSTRGSPPGSLPGKSGLLIPHLTQTPPPSRTIAA